MKRQIIWYPIRHFDFWSLHPLEGTTNTFGELARNRSIFRKHFFYKQVLDWHKTFKMLCHITKFQNYEILSKSLVPTDYFAWTSRVCSSYGEILAHNLCKLIFPLVEVQNLLTKPFNFFQRPRMNKFQKSPHGNIVFAITDSLVTPSQYNYPRDDIPPFTL